jgi:hypothetical protein
MMIPLTPAVTLVPRVSSGLQWVPLFALGRVSTGSPVTEFHRPVSHGRPFPATVGGGGRMVPITAYRGLSRLHS